MPGGVTAAQRRSRRWIKAHPLVALIVAATLVRAVYLRLTFNTSRAADTDLYLGIARSIADGHPTTKGYPLQALYSLLLSPAYILNVSVDGWVIALHLVLSVATVVVLYQLARLILEPRTALVVGAAAVVWPSFLFWTRFIVTETLFLFLLACFLLVCTRQLFTPSASWTRRLSLVASATSVALCRSAGILIVWGALLVLLGASVRRRRGPANARRAVLGAVVVSMLCVASVLAVPPTREKVLGLTNVSWALWLSTVKFHADLDHAAIAAAPPRDLRDLPQDEQNRELSERGLEFIRERPADYVSRVGIRVANFWFPWLTADWSRSHVGLDVLLSLGLAMLALGAFFAPPAGARRDVLALLLVVIAIQTLVVAFGELDSDARYRVPVELPLLVVAGMTLDGVRRRINRVPAVVEPSTRFETDDHQEPARRPAALGNRR